MERVKKDMPLWKKKTPGVLIITAPIRMRLKPKQEFRATPEELGRHIGDFELLEGDVDFKKYPQLQKEDVKTPAPPEEYTVDHVGKGKYNVLSPSGKRMNEGELTSKEAEKLCKELSKRSNE